MTLRCVVYAWQAVVTPRLARFRPEDAGQPLEQAKVDRVIDDIVCVVPPTSDVCSLKMFEKCI